LRSKNPFGNATQGRYAGALLLCYAAHFLRSASLKKP
jgi:hypothetical protein